MSDSSDKKAKQGLLILLTNILFGIIAAYSTNIYFNPSELISISPAIGTILAQLFLFRMFEIPKPRGLKDDLFIIIMTLFSWFISLTILLQL